VEQIIDGMTKRMIEGFTVLSQLVHGFVRGKSAIDAVIQGPPARSES